MSIIIKGMDMPKGCYDCLIPCDKMVYERSRPSNCPLIEIVTCKDCEYADEYYHCKYTEWWNGNSDFCSHGIPRKEKR